MFYILGVVYHNSWWQRWYGYLERAESDLSFAMDEPFEELVSGLKKPYTIASQRKCTRRSSMLQGQLILLRAGKNKSR